MLRSCRVRHIALPSSTPLSARRRQIGSRRLAVRDATSSASSPSPVEEGERREVTIEAIGDQGDGIAKAKRGFVVIVPNTNPGDEPIVEIREVRPNVAFASVIESDPRTL